MSRPTRHPETIVLHAGWRADPATGAVAPPIYQTTSFQFHSAEHASNLFALKELGNIYTRIGNPTTDILEQRMAAPQIRSWGPLASRRAARWFPDGVWGGSCASLQFLVKSALILPAPSR